MTQKIKKVQWNKNKNELVIGIVFCLFILSTIVWAVKVYAELIQDVSIGKLIFYSVIIIFFTFKLGDLFTMGFRNMLNKKNGRK